VLGLLVDAVSEVREIAAADIAPPPGFGAGLRRDFIRGMGRIDDRFVILLDTDTALDLHDVSAAATVGLAA
ncbi:chemotaxis protein CheW, partial [Xanthomonas sp. Kuri4-3]